MNEIREEILNLVIDLVRIKSTADRPEELKRVIDYAENYLRGTPLKITRYERNGKHSLIATFRDTKEPDVMFVGHMDVVEAEDWQFEPKIEGDRIFGRGVIDMKGPDAVMLALFKKLAELGKQPDIGLMLTTDEEVGSENGVEYLLKEEGWGARFAVIPDGGGALNIVYRGKGVVHLRAKAKGKAYHGSMPWMGENAIDKIISFYTELKGHFPKEPCGDPIHWHNTINLGRISGGKVVNQIPDHAEADIDIRFVKPWTSKKMFDFVKGIADKYSVELELISRGEPVETDPEHPYVQAFKRAAESVLGRNVELVVEYGATDGRFFAEKDIPNIVTCAEGGGAHSKDEWARISSYGELFDTMMKFLEEIGK